MLFIVTYLDRFIPLIDGNRIINLTLYLLLCDFEKHFDWSFT